MPVESPVIQSELTETLVSFQNSQGLELQATLLKLTRFQVCFEVYSASGVLRMSEALENFKILIQNEPVYCGRAVITNFIQLGSVSVCEAILEEASFDLTRVVPASDTSDLLSRFEHSIRD